MKRCARTRVSRDRLCAGSIALCLGGAWWLSTANVIASHAYRLDLGTFIGAGFDALELRPQELARDDEGVLQLFAKIREAEIAANDADLTACATDAEQLATVARTRATERIALARRAISERNAARSGPALARVEEEIAEARLALLRAPGSGEIDGEESEVAKDLATELARSVQRAVERELKFEAAEDLLLRRIAADNSDTALALGVATTSERAAIETTLARVRLLLPTPLLEAVLTANANDIATDPATFRAAMLGGILALAESDVARDVAADLATSDAEAATHLTRVHERRTDAARLLKIASRTELPLPRVIRDLLMLAEARTGTSEGDARGRMLAGASRSSDPAIALVAGLELAQSNARAAGIPIPSDDALAVIAACGDARRQANAVLREGRVASDAPTADAMLALLFERAALRAKETDGADDALAALAAACAQRFDRPMRILASQPTTTPLYAALAMLRSDADGLRVELSPSEGANQQTLADQAARDPKIASWFAIPYASALVRLDPANAGRASDLLLALAERASPSARTRAALAIALDERRARGARSPKDETRLAEALAMAARVFKRDPSRDDWMLASFDLAAFPRFRARDLALAERLLAEVESTSSARELRAIELALLREPAATELVALREHAAAHGRSIAGEPIGSRARSDAVRAAIALRTGALAEAATLAANAIDTDPLSQAAERAAATWVASLTTSVSKGGSADPGVKAGPIAAPT
ncbi:MAG: hypothetical protein ACKO3W_11785, partial [bacterium]